MAKKPRKPRLDQYEAFRLASGWYLAAWRDKKGLTLEELAEAAGTSKGMVSDLETGALNSKGVQAQRFNKDWLFKFAKALEITAGHLIEVNPYAAEPGWLKLESEFGGLSDGEQRQVAAYIEGLKAKR